MKGQGIAQGGWEKIFGAVLSSPFICLPLVNLVLGAPFSWRLFLIGVGIIAATTIPYEELKAKNSAREKNSEK